jgi:hypothetical protein
MRWLDGLSGAEASELPSRAERRRAARERHRVGGPLWTDKDRHLDPGSLPGIAEIANTRGTGRPLALPYLRKPRKPE